jgi:hypothetical protein
MKYIIIGGGPTGLSLGYALCDGGHKVEIIEKDKQLGGSWNSQWIDNLYWSENSPRILVYRENTKLLLNDLGLNKDSVSYVYGNYIKMQLKVIRSALDYLYLSDIIKIVSKIVKERFTKDKNLTVQDWLDMSTLNINAKKYIKMTCIILCDRPDNTNLKDFMRSAVEFGKITPYQFKDTNKWHKLIEKKIKDNNGFIYKNTEVVKLLEKNNKISCVVIKDLNTNEISTKSADRVVLCCQSTGILDVLEASNSKVKNNWINYGWIENWCKNTYYIGFGFQLHFFDNIKFPEKWCWSCGSDWNVIILPVSQWLDNKTKNKNVEAVWSCCIVDMDVKSKRINKTANQCSKDEVIEECIKQINENYKLPKHYTITISEGLQHYDGKWQSKNTGFTRKDLGHLPIKGNIENLYALGCFTKGKRPTIAHMGTAVDASVKFLNLYESDVKSFHNKNYVINLLFKFLLFIVVAIILVIILRRYTNNIFGIKIK